MRQSVEKMVRIKQTLIESTQTEGGNNHSTKVTDKEFAGPFVKGLMKPSNLLTSIGNNT